MSISKAADTRHDATYEDFERQWMRTYFQVAADQLGADEFDIYPEALRFDPVGDDRLNRTHVAELVGLNVFQHHTFSGVTATAEGAFQDAISLSLSEGAMDLELDPLNEYTVTDGELATGTDLDIQSKIIGDDDILYFRESIAHNDFNDTVNQVAGGADEGRTEIWSMNYRDWYGRGPLVDHRDALYLSYAFAVNNVSDHKVRSEFNCQLVWDVYDVDDVDSEEVRSLVPRR